MANNHNQYMQDSINQTKDSLQQVTFDIGSTNSHLEKLETQVQQQFDTMYGKFMKQFNTLKSVVNQLLN
jgi:archaellum component FlaC